MENYEYTKLKYLNIGDRIITEQPGWAKRLRRYDTISWIVAEIYSNRVELITKVRWVDSYSEGPETRNGYIKNNLYPVSGSLPHDRGIHKLLSYTFYNNLSPLFRNALLEQQMELYVGDSKVQFPAKLRLPTKEEATSFFDINPSRVLTKWEKLHSVVIRQSISDILYNYIENQLSDNWIEYLDFMGVEEEELHQIDIYDHESLGLTREQFEESIIDFLEYTQSYDTVSYSIENGIMLLDGHDTPDKNHIIYFDGYDFLTAYLDNLFNISVVAYLKPNTPIFRNIETGNYSLYPNI